MTLNNFLSSGFEFNENEYGLKLQYSLFNSVLLISVTVLTVLTLFRIYNEQYVQAGFDYFIAVISLIGLFFLRRSRAHMKVISTVFLVSYFIFISFSYVNVHKDILGPSWYIVYLFPIFFLYGKKVGIGVSILSLMTITILSFLTENPYSLTQFFYVVLPLLVSSFFIIIYESRNSVTQAMLDAKNQLLEHEVKLTMEEQNEVVERHSELAHIIDDSSIEVYIVDFETDLYLYANQGAIKTLGYTYEEMLEMSIYDINPSLTPDIVKHLKKMSPQMTNIVNITQHKRKNGSLYSVQSFIHVSTYEGKQAYIIYDMDITDKQSTEEELLRQKELYNYQAHYDALTDLPNRILFLDRLTQAIYKSNRSMKSVALLFIDLDQFKQINDSFGHETGDRVLQEVSVRLKKLLRHTDTLARLGGDEFTVIMEQVPSPHFTSTLAQKIIDILKTAIVVEEREFFVTCSIGISFYPEDADEPTILLRNADAAMYKAKDEGRNTYSFYTEDMTKSAFERLALENDLKRAIKNNEFIIYYQAQFNALTEKIIGMEALIRWQHPQKGLISPITFIPLAEENGMIVEIDRLMMRDAMTQFVVWQKAGLHPGVLSLNLSVKQLVKDDFCDLLKEMLHTTECQPEWLKLEVTEGQIMANPDKAIAMLKQISDLGVSIAIDDFGTGYSSLSYLKKLPIKQLKIDQSFVRDLSQDEEDMAITKTIIVLAKSLLLDVIAEGVETQEQKDFLLENGCIAMQGYLFAKPVSSREMQERLKNNR
jgi:diguanylate cyclase (GGDEF)-like protein/PAS domain S-box-containing protein